MLIELLIRFIIGGLIVSAFALLGDIIRPRGFAGLFSAAPSVAVATLGLTFMAHGGPYAGIEGRSMLIGAAALFCYSLVVGWLLLRRRLSTLSVASASCLLWLGVAFGLWGALLR